MANVKSIHIEGWMPFNIYEDEQAKGWLGLMNSPSIGFRVSYGRQKLEPNDKGGKTTFYHFFISGQEAMRFEAFERMVEDFKAAGCVIEEQFVEDLEA